MFRIALSHTTQKQKPNSHNLHNFNTQLSSQFISSFVDHRTILSTYMPQKYFNQIITFMIFTKNYLLIELIQR